MVVDETETEVSVHLRWTAPGDELDSGTSNGNNKIIHSFSLIIYI